MKIAVTGATGFIGRYILRELARQGHAVRGWQRPDSDPTGLDDLAGSLEWRIGVLGDAADAVALVEGCDAVVHAALFHQSRNFIDEAIYLDFVQTNVVGTFQLIQAARAAGVKRFVFLSSCAVYGTILDDRPLDEVHPLWPNNLYGAHKAAIEQFVHSFGLEEGYPICALRPTGVYGVAHPVRESKWFDLVRAVMGNETVPCSRGGKEVHAADVARAVALLLAAPAEQIAGQAFNCCDLYVSEWDVANIACDYAKSRANLRGGQTQPKHQIETGKLRALGMTFGGRPQLEATIHTLVDALR
jgi:nucleoside-diphosphate-sugar epimerase